MSDPSYTSYRLDSDEEDNIHPTENGLGGQEYPPERGFRPFSPASNLSSGSPLPRISSPHLRFGPPPTPPRRRPAPNVSAFVQDLQKSCEETVRRIKNLSIISTSSWATPLTAAPSAISVMAILLKTADARVAAGLTVSSVDVTDVDTSVVVGRLPSQYFHVNLQYCSDVGRLAFLEAEATMNLIQKIAQRMTGHKGRVACIVNLLNDPEDAVYDLIPEVNNVKESALQCLEKAREISQRFAYWHLVILHLKRCSLERQGVVIREQEVVEDDKQKTDLQQISWTEKRIALEGQIKRMETRLEESREELRSAKQELQSIVRAPPIPIPSLLESYQQSASLSPFTRVKPRRRGIFEGIIEAISGESRESMREDAEDRRAQFEEMRRMENEMFEREKHRRQQLKSEAEKRVESAAKEKERLTHEVEKAYSDLSESEDRLAEARTNIERAKIQMAKLETKALELKDIEKILKASSDQLGNLKRQVEPLVDFFKSLLVGIDQGVSERVKDFLRPIERRIHSNTSRPDEVNMLRLGRTAKEHMFEAAFEMQCQFSVIVDIAGAYVTISSECIRPAINDMEELSTCPEGKWPAKSRNFLKTCAKWSKEIERIARETTRNAPKNMKQEMVHLQDRVLAAAR